LINCILLCE